MKGSDTTLNIGLISLIVHGEAENCSYEEKKWIAHVILNRLSQPYLFRSLEKDFKGLSRRIKIENNLERQAFIDSINAVLEAIEEHKLKIDPTQGATFFAVKKFIRNKDPTVVFGVLVEEVNTPESFAHVFFKLR